MPKYLVTNGSYFEPFTYDELAKPVMQAVEAHSATQDVYDTITAETEALRQYLLREPEDSEARRMYENYVAKLETLQNNLWTKGFNASTRRDLSAARAGYASDITRLGTAIKSRQDRSAEYWKTKHDHPDMIMGTDPGLSPLDAYLGNDRFGQDYFSYSGDVFMNEVGNDAKARMDEMLNDPRILDKYPQLVGYIPILKKDGFSSSQVQNAVRAVRSYYGGNDRALDNLDFASGVLADVLLSHVDSTGARGNVSPTEFDRLLRYGEAGLAQSIGKSDVQFLKDLKWEQDQKLDYALKVAAAKAAAKGGGAGASGSYAPPIAQLRGNALSGISDKNQAKDFVDKTNVYQALDVINQLKKSGALRQPNGMLTDTANEAVMKLYKSPYYKELTKGKDHFLTEADLDSVIANLGKELNQYEKNDHLYQFNNTGAANSNIARNVFKPNIGQLSGKQGDKIAAANAHYSDGKAVSGKELMSILESENLLIGFDAKSGNLTIQRNSSDDSQDKGKYNDKVVYLNTRNALTGTSGYANAATILYAFDSAVPDEVPSSDRDAMRNRIPMSTMGQTIDLRDLADLIRGSYQSLVKDGDDNDRAVFNALVESFAQGLYDSSNTPWAPNTYKEGWSARTGGDYISNGEDEYFDYDFDY